MIISIIFVNNTKKNFKLIIVMIHIIHDNLVFCYFSHTVQTENSFSPEITTFNVVFLYSIFHYVSFLIRLKTKIIIIVENN